MVTNRYRILFFTSATCFKPSGRRIPNAVDQAMRQLYIVGSRPWRCDRLDQLEFQG
jgi:hypothetical protein